MAENWIVCNRSILGKGLHRVIIRAPDSVRVWESLQEELFKQFTMFHDGICHTCFDAQTACFDELCRGRSPTCLQPGKSACLPPPPLRGYPATPRYGNGASLGRLPVRLAPSHIPIARASGAAAVTVQSMER